MSIDTLKEAPAAELINAMIESGFLIRLSDDRVEYILGDKSYPANIFGAIFHISSKPNIVKIEPALRNELDRAYKVSGYDCILLTNRSRDKSVWVHRNSHERYYKEAKTEEMLENFPEDMIEQIIFNMHLF